MKWKVTLQFPVSTLPWSHRWGWGREITPSVNTHPHYTIVPPVSSSPTQCGKSLSCYLPILPSPLSLYCNTTVSPPFLSLAFEFFGRRNWYRRHLCLWLVFRVGGLCLHWVSAKSLLYCCPSPSGVFGLYLCSAAAFTGERQPVDFRETCQVECTLLFWSASHWGELCRIGSPLTFEEGEIFS